MATRKEVAAYAGVSEATVSYVLNKTKHVTPEVKARVEEAARELHYTPNLVARGLATRRMQHVAMLVNNLRNPHYVEMLAGAQSVASKKGYIVSIILVDYSNEEEGLRLTARGVDGAIVATVDTATTASFLDGKMPYVLPGEDGQMDYRDGILAAVKSLKEKGHRKVAFLSGLHLQSENHSRYRYLQEAFSLYGIPLTEELLVDGNEREDTDEAAGAQAVRSLLERKCSFTAVIALNDLMAFGAMRELKDHGLRVPEDVSVVGCDNVEMGRYYIPSLSTLDVDSFSIGKVLMKNLIAKINHRPGKEYKVNASYVERESVAECREIQE